MGSFCYADDVILLAPTRHSLQLMLNICEEFSNSHNMLFSTDPNPVKSKTKCLYFSMNQNKSDPEKVTLNGDKLPWVSNAKHLGNVINTDITKHFCYPVTSKDLLIKRAIFYDRVHSLKQEFGFCSKRLLCELLRIYATSFYSSMIWDIQSEEYCKLTRSYNTAIKLLWDLPHQTHKNFVEQLTDCPHLQSMLHSRYVGFSKSLLFSKKLEVRLLFNLCKYDLTTVTGTNLKKLMTTYECSSIENLIDTKSQISMKSVHPMKEEDQWKVLLLEDLVELRDGRSEANLSLDEINDLILFVTTS